MKKTYLKTVSVAAVLTALSITSMAHPGRLDSNGGHNKTADGTYHYHVGTDRSVEYATKEEAETAANGGVVNTVTNEIKVFLDGTQISFDQPPIIESGRTLVPLRAIFEALGATVDWDNDTQTVTAVKDGTTVVLTIGSSVMLVNGDNKTLDVPAQLVGGRTLVPARAVAESFGVAVSWDAAANAVVLVSPISGDKFAQFENALTASGANFEKITMAAEMVGAVEGVKYTSADWQIELYRFDENSDAYKAAYASGTLTLDGFGSFPARVSGGMALVVDGLSSAFLANVEQIFNNLK